MSNATKRAKEALESTQTNLNLSRKEVARLRDQAGLPQQSTLPRSESAPLRTVSDVLRIASSDSLGVEEPSEYPLTSSQKSSPSKSFSRSFSRSMSQSWTPVADLPRSHVASEKLAQRIEDMSMGDLMHEWDRSRFWGPPMTHPILKFLPKLERGALLAASRHVYTASKQKKANKRRSELSDLHESELELQRSLFAPSTHWSKHRRSVPLPGTFGSALPEVTTGTGHWNKGAKQARKRIIDAPLDSSLFEHRPEEERGHIGDIAALAKNLHKVQKKWEDKAHVTPNSSPSRRTRGLAAARKRAPQSNPFKDFLFAYEGQKPEPHEERFTKQTRIVATDPRVLKVYMYAMKRRSQALQDRERNMDVKTLFENAKLFHGNNYKALGKESPRPDWTGPQDVRDLIMDCEAGDRSRRLALSKPVQQYQVQPVLRGSLIKELKGGFGARKAEFEAADAVHTLDASAPEPGKEEFKEPITRRLTLKNLDAFMDKKMEKPARRRSSL